MLKMEVTALVTGKSYWQIEFGDIPEWWILGVRCACCGHEAPVDRDRLKRRSGQTYLRFATKSCRCKICETKSSLHRVFIAGKLPR